MRLVRGVRDGRAIAVSLAVALISGCTAYDPSALELGDANPHPHEDGGAHDAAPADAHADAANDGAPSDAGPLECDDSQKNPTCTRAHALTACLEGQCLLVQCQSPWVDCNGDPDDGCEATLDSPQNCGICGARCTLPHAQTSCSEGKCDFRACEDGWGDCDGDPGNGCETSLSTLDDCGGCGKHCDAPDHAAPGCDDGTCGVGQCLGPYGDCDGDASNGCELLLTGLDDCGACDMACAPGHASGNCDSGSCTVDSCKSPYVDCDGLVTNGCEATLETPQHCGDCATSCDLGAHVTKAACDTSAVCGVDHHCDPETVGCTDDAPQNGCEDGYADCDNDGSNGCETSLRTLSHCGTCTDTCKTAGAVTSCDSGSCEVMNCLPGYEKCGSSSACASLASDPQNCGQCGHVCSGATPMCAGGKCTGQTCAMGSADCNGTASDGCEASLSLPTSCGQCGLSCGPYAHATAGCDGNGNCTLTGCANGYLDCDGVVENGCEVDTHTLDHCGGCDKPCALAFAAESCADGSCELGQCDVARADCDGNPLNGCETNLLLPGNCGACGRDCTKLPNVQSGGCDSEETCRIVCKPGYLDCDGNPLNGCETDEAAAESCGGCNNNCSKLPNIASASCDGTLCTNLKCKPGFGDCDGVTANGCERALDTETDCGACNKPCAPAHASGMCNAGACQVVSCNNGYADCNGKADDGCEASLNEPAHCGSCSKSCNSGMYCDNGECACTESSQCGGASLECCSNRCVNTYSVCSLWPCPVPGTARPITDCGGCGVFCPLALPGALFCCGALGE